MSFGLQSARNSKPNKSRDALRMISCISATSASILSMVSSIKKLSCAHPIRGRWLARMITRRISSAALACIGKFKNVRSSPGRPVAVNDQPSVQVIGTQCAALVVTRSSQAFSTG